MNSQQLFIVIVAIFSFDFLLNQILNYLNFQYQKTAIPEELKEAYDEKKIRKAREYQKTNTCFEFYLYLQVKKEQPQKRLRSKNRAVFQVSF